MSGVVGAIAFKDGSWRVTEPYLTAMRDTMAHRGPDGAGLWLSDDARIGLGHRQLSSEKTSPRQSQPAGSEDGTLWISFDGEIYNRAEIRSELKTRGAQNGDPDLSDAQLVLQAFRLWGISCVDRFNGMFAFGLWDSRAGQLWLVRDRLGLKPLYISRHHGRLTFASEIKALLQDPDQSRVVNERALYDYLSFLAAPAPQTFFQGIEKLPSGTWLRIDVDGKTREARYWDLFEQQQSLVGRSDEEIVDLILSDLRRAVGLRAEGQGRIGVWSSAGIDSAIITALLSEHRPIASFTYSFAGDSETYSVEPEAARAMGEALGYESYMNRITIDDTIAALPHIAWLQDEPIGDPNCIAYYTTAKLARESGYGACHMGIGADELFMGKEHTPVLLRLQRLNDWPIPGRVKRLGLAGLQLADKGDSWPYERLRRAAAGEPIYWVGDESFTDSQKRRLLSARLKNTLKDYTSYEAIRPIRRRFEDKADTRNYFNWMTYADLNLKVPDWFLMRSDKMSMGASHELRSPFLDHEFVELAAGIPEAVHRRDGTRKQVLQKVVDRLVSRDLVTRAQYAVFPYEWLFGKLGTMARDELASFCDQTDLFDGNEVARFVSAMQADKRVHRARQVWALFNVALWWKAHMT